MATVLRDPRDTLVEKVKQVLEAYEREHPGADASLYRQNSAAICIRVVDRAFEGLSKGARHDQVWRFISQRLSEDDVQEIWILLLLTPEEQQSSFLNAEFNDPIPSSI